MAASKKRQTKPAVIKCSPGALYFFLMKFIGSYSCNLDSAGWSTCTSPWTQTLAAGSHTLQIKALDVAGNVSTVSSTTWIIDLTAPSLSISSSPANPINSANASLVFSATDSGGGTVASYSCKLDGGVTPVAQALLVTQHWLMVLTLFM